MGAGVAKLVGVSTWLNLPTINMAFPEPNVCLVERTLEGKSLLFPPIVAIPQSYITLVGSAAWQSPLLINILPLKLLLLTWAQITHPLVMVAGLNVLVMGR